MCAGFGSGNLRERDHFEDPGVDGRVILKRIFKKWDGDMDRIDLDQDRDKFAGTCEGGNEYSGSKKCREFLDWRRNC